MEIQNNNSSDEFYLRTEFQRTLEKADYLSRLPSPQQTPYDNKYKAIKILSTLKPTPYSFIVQSVLADIYADVDQNHDAVKAYIEAVHIFQNFSKKEENKNHVHRYYNTLIHLYNMLGLTYLNRDQNEEGVGMLAKAALVYEAFKDISYTPVYHSRNYPESGATFAYFYEGGIDPKKMEESYTLTQFYLAQAYTKLGFKDKAAEYCGRTLQRQFATKTFELKDFCLNLVSLAEYYQTNRFFAQAQYLLLSGLKVLPANHKKKLHATLYMGLGTMMKELLGFCAICIANQQDLGVESDEILSRKIFQFEGIDLKFPKITMARDLEACKSLFRQANTQYKKALETYVLDGYVTEHIDILFHQSKLYKHLCLIEPSIQRRIAMIDKRNELLQPILKQLNPKAYQNTWERILVELAEIMNQLFQQKYRQLQELSKTKALSDSKLKSLNECGTQSIDYYMQIEKTLLESKDVEKNHAYFQSIINAKFNIAKAYSRLFSNDIKVRVEFLKQSLARYNNLRQYIADLRKQNLCKPEDFKREEQMTDEMVGMLPAKIDRVNYGVHNPLD